jgi:hypothetical protein
VVDYVGLRAVARSLIQEFGRPLSLVPLAAPLDDPNKPWRGSTVPPTSVAGVGVVIPYREENAVGSLERRPSARVYMILDGAETFDANDYGSVIDTLNSTSWRITSFEEIKPGADQVVVILSVEI